MDLHQGMDISKIILGWKSNAADPPVSDWFSFQYKEALPDLLHFSHSLIIKCREVAAALPAVCRLSLSGSRRSGHRWPLPTLRCNPLDVRPTLTALHRLKPETRLSPSLLAALISAEKSFIFSPHQTLCVEKFALNFVTAEKCGAHARRCHAATGGQGSKGLMGLRGLREGVRGEIPKWHSY